jgi:hypothetical protein
VVAAALGVPANVVAVWSQSGDPTAGSDPVIGLLTSGFGGAPRGIRTPNRQIRSQPSPIPTRPPDPFASPLVLVNGYVAGRSRTSVPSRHAWLGRKVVAVSDRCGQTGRLVTGRSPGRAESRAPDSRSGALAYDFSISLHCFVGDVHHGPIKKSPSTSSTSAHGRQPTLGGCP